MRSFGRVMLAITLMLAIFAGASLGTGLGYLDVWFLSSRISFAQTADYLTVAQLLVRYLLLVVNGLYGSMLGLVAGILLLCRGREQQQARQPLSGAISGALVAGILGALLGYVDIAVLSQYLNLASSDNAAAWRENRSFLVMINGGVGFVVGAIVGVAADPSNKLIRRLV